MVKMEKVVVEYNIPIQGEEDCEKQNKMCAEMFGKDQYAPIQPTEDHIGILFEKLQDAIEKVGDDGGWYVSDRIKVRIELEYHPENK
jgi:hypothetical protein